ncbi:MAG: IPT/TIG domain-containing protein, partial [Deltaproteobacteria bacterium]|nr:IPT/TIG domain-containing protein [Deltaproteobacteria bacterium]
MQFKYDVMCVVLVAIAITGNPALHAKTLPAAQPAAASSVTDSEVTVSSISATDVFPGDDVTLTGTGLDSKKAKFLIGKKPLKVKARTASEATVTLPAKVQSGPLILKVGKAATETPYQIRVFQAPVLKKVPGSAPKGGTLQVQGKGLSGVSQWQLGNVSLSVDDGAKNTDRKVTLRLPQNAPDEAAICAIVNGRRFPFNKNTITGVAPRIDQVLYLSPPDKKTRYFGIADGENLSETTTLKINGKSADVMLDTQNGKIALGFVYKKKLPKKTLKFVAANGPFASDPFEVDGKTMGFSIAAEELDKAVFREPPQLEMNRIRRELESVEARMEGKCLWWSRTLASQSPKDAEMAKSMGECAGAYLEVMMWLRYYQGVLCRAMDDGTAAANANAEAGKMLTRSTADFIAVAEERLDQMWEKTTAGMASGGAEKKLQIGKTIDLMEKLVESRHYAQRSCENKTFTAEGGEQKSAKAIVTHDLESAF